MSSRVGPANVLALQHGVRSKQVFLPLAEELLEGLLAVRPDLASYRWAVAAWAETEARAALLRQWIAEHGVFDGDGSTREGPLKWLATFERQAESLRSKLGLDPRSDASLAKERADATTAVVDLEAIRREGRRARGLDVGVAVVPEPSGTVTEQVRGLAGSGTDAE